MEAKAITCGTGAALVLTLTLMLAPAVMAQDVDAPAAEQPATEQLESDQPAAAAAEPALLKRLGVDARASGELSTDELRTRIDKLVATLKEASLKGDAKRQVRAQLKADRQELKRREAAAALAATAGEQAEQPPPPAEQPAATSTEPPARSTEETAPPAAESAAETASEKPTQPTAEPPPPIEQPAQATGEQAQPPAEGAAEAPSAQPTPTAAAEQPAPATVEQAPPPADVDEPPQVSAAAEAQAMALLADARPAEALSDDALKERVERYRDLLGEADLSRKTAKALRQRLKTDREALRARVAAQEAAAQVAQQQAVQAPPAQQQSVQVPPAQQQPTQQVQPAAPAEVQQQAVQAPPAAPPVQQQPVQAPPVQQQPAQQVQPAAPAEQMQQTTARQTQQAIAPEQQTKQQPQALAAPPATTVPPENVPLEIAPLLPLVLAPTVAEIPLLLADRRPAQALADAELNRRILAYREALQDEEAYSQDDLTLFDRQLRADRLELNNRLLADRSQRAAVYEEWTNPNIDINTEPEPGEPQAPNSIFAAEVDDEEMWDQLVAAPLEPLTHRYSRDQVVEEPEFVMNLPEVREAMPSIELDTITFGFNEAFVREEEIFDLDRIARMIESVVAAHPDEIFMIEGHTDAVGSDAYNLKLSRQRAQAVKAALTRYYVIPPENLATVGLGERYLKIRTPEAEEENRRVTVRRVTPLLSGYDAEE